MRTHNRTEPVKIRAGQLPDITSPSRAALYSDRQGASLLSCGRKARENGDRIVSAACRGEDRRRGRQTLYDLIERMLEGEFDTIVAAVASDGKAHDAVRVVRLSCTPMDRWSGRAFASTGRTVHAAG